MIRSMTAFARRDRDTKWGNFYWELRSVNHRYLEVSLKLPEELRAFEAKFRSLISDRLKRGRVDGILRFNQSEALSADLELDREVVNRVAEIEGQIRGMMPEAERLRAADILRWPGVLKAAETDSDAMVKEAEELLSTALDDLMASRESEGGRLESLVRQRLEDIVPIVKEVHSILPELEAAYRARIDDRLGEMREQIDPERLEQEVVLFLQKSDVTEELDRLETHVDEVTGVLERDDAVGRRLDFLMQELNREANTLGSKAADTRLTNASVELKVLIEQMREQVQNIE